MAYVDLNPVRAGIAQTPEASEFTSIYARIRQSSTAASASTAPDNSTCSVTAPLLAFRDAAAPTEHAIPYRFIDYLQLLDWTGRAVRANKTGAIDQRAPPILMRLNIDSDAWQAAMQPAGNVFGRALGRLDRLQLHAGALGQSWIKGIRQAKRLYRTA